MKRVLSRGNKFCILLPGDYPDIVRVAVTEKDAISGKEIEWVQLRHAQGPDGMFIHPPTDVSMSGAGNEHYLLAKTPGWRNAGYYLKVVDKDGGVTRIAFADIECPDPTQAIRDVQGPP